MSVSKSLAAKPKKNLSLKQKLEISDKLQILRKERSVDLDTTHKATQQNHFCDFYGVSKGEISRIKNCSAAEVAQWREQVERGAGDRTRNQV
jgi:hypothetical protein